MEPIEISTHGLPISQQLDAWQGWFDTVFDLHILEPELGFAAKSVHWSFGSMSLSRVAAPALRAVRSKALLRRNPVDHWVITVGGRKTFGISAGGIAFEVPAGIPFVASLGQELVSQRAQDERLQLYLPRDSFSDLACVLDAVQGTPLNTPLGRLLGDYIRLLERSLHDLTTADAPKLMEAVKTMILACLSPSADPQAARQILLSRREKAKQAIVKHLRHPSLGPESLCRELGMSRSQLYRLLKNDGGIAQYIQRLRLLQAHAELSDASNEGSIRSIAESFCFQDGSSFARAFKLEFGVSPSDVRAAALAGHGSIARPRSVQSSQFGTLGDCLRHF